MEELTAFERGQIVGALLAGSSETKAAELCNVSKATVAKVMAAYEKDGQAALARKRSRRRLKQSETASKNDDVAVSQEPTESKKEEP